MRCKYPNCCDCPFRNSRLSEDIESHLTHYFVATFRGLRNVAVGEAGDVQNVGNGRWRATVFMWGRPIWAKNESESCREMFTNIRDVDIDVEQCMYSLVPKAEFTGTFPWS